MSDVATSTDVSRLFGRAAFGATTNDLHTWTGGSYGAAVDSLFPPGPPGTIGRLPYTDDWEQSVTEYQTTDVGTAQRWWLERMRVGPYPLEERLTLFWHDHFATAALGEPDVGTAMLQNRTLRANALGSFRTLANAMTVDAAMLYWLNGIANREGGVNENYAREFFELFTLGVFPQVYTETDIREAAKAFTGFAVNTTLRAAQFSAPRHTPGTKTILGRTVGGHLPGSPEEALEYTEVTEAALAHDGGRTVSRFLAYKLVLEFGYSPNTANLAGDPVVEAVASAIRAGDAWDLRAGVRTMLLHPGWRYASSASGYDLVRSPVEIIVHAAKILNYPPVPWGSLLWPQQVMPAAERTGQLLFLPPNVGGWPNGLAWLSQVSNLARYDVMVTLVTYWKNLGLDTLGAMPPSGDLDAWAWYMGLPGFGTNTTLRLREFLADPGTTVEVEKQMSMFILVGCCPEWQVM
jgi:uncharacterized protein (DUF1800 family)